jgi:hypothetical protein
LKAQHRRVQDGEDHAACNAERYARENMMRLFILMAAILAILGNAVESDATKVKFENWRQDKPCGHKLADPVEVVAAGCQAAYCVNISDSSQVCACLPSEDSDEAQVTYKKDGVVVLQWNTAIYPPAVASALRVDTADVNGDGKEELVIAMMSSASSGMGIESWEVRILTDDKISNPVYVEDYGLMGYLSSNGKQCRLLVTRWIEGWEPKKEYGLYLVGRWFDLSDHNLRYTLYRPAIKRRYLDSLKQLRLQGSHKGRKPVMWFRDPEASPIVGPYPFRD